MQLYLANKSIHQIKNDINKSKKTHRLMNNNIGNSQILKNKNKYR